MAINEPPNWNAGTKDTLISSVMWRFLPHCTFLCVCLSFKPGCQHHGAHLQVKEGIIVKAHYRLPCWSSIQGLLFCSVEVRNWLKVEKCGLITDWPAGSCCGPQSILINESLRWRSRLLHPQSRHLPACFAAFCPSVLCCVVCCVVW